MSTLSAHALRKTYKGRTVVSGVSLEMTRGEVVGLLGTNGAGKTTSFYMMVGLVKPDAGTVRLDGKDITRLPMYRRALAGLGYLPQEPSAFRKLTTAENLLLVLEMQRGLSRAAQKARCDELIEQMQLGPVRNNLAQTLSGGERRRAEIARVLATRPAFILLDEPFTGIDPIHREDLQSVITELKRQDIGVLITDHNELATLQITDRAYIISEGEIKTSGTSAELAVDPIAQKYYLSESSAQLIQADAQRRLAVTHPEQIACWACEVCGEPHSTEEAAQAGYRHSEDGGRLIPIRRKGGK